MKALLISAALTSFLLVACKPSTDTKSPEATPPADTVAAPVAPVPAADVSSPAGIGPASPPVASDDTTINASIDRLLGDHAKYQAMINAYQKAVTDGDKAAVAALVNYPLAVTIDGKQTAISDAVAFVGHYDQIITPAIASVIKAQDYPALMVNAKVVMFGSGETWISGICRPDSADCSEFDVKVIAIQPGG